MSAPTRRSSATSSRAIMPARRSTDRPATVCARWTCISMPTTLRGTGEGRFPEGDRLIINGTVGAVKPSAPADQAGRHPDPALSWRSADRARPRQDAVRGPGLAAGLCQRAGLRMPTPSSRSCRAPRFPRLREGDKSLLVPGSLVTVAIVKTADGNSVTPGVIVEKPAPAPVEKPQSAPLSLALPCLPEKSYVPSPGFPVRRAAGRDARWWRKPRPSSAHGAWTSPRWIRRSSRATISSCYVNGGWLKTR